jgi:hypothetical protein
MANEIQTLYAVYRYELRQSIASACGDLVLVAPQSGAAGKTDLVDTNLPEAADFYNYWSLGFYAGDNIDVIRAVTTWVLTTHTLSFAAVTAVVDTADLAELHKKFTMEQYNDAINRAIRRSQRFFKYPNVDETLHFMAYKLGESRYMKREYDIPSGFDYISDVWVESTQRHLLEDCDATWTGVDTDVTQEVDDADYQEGGASIKFTVAVTISNGDVIAYKNLASAEDLSPYKKISFWIQVSSAVAAADLCLLLDNTPGCGSPLETISLPAITVNTPTFVECVLANPASDTAITSIGFEYNANKKANIIWVDDIRAVMDGQPRFDYPLDRRSWSIVHASTPLLKLHNEVGITPGKTLRLEGWKHQVTISSDASTCAVPPDFIIQQALAYLLQSKPEYDAEMKAAQALAEDEKRNIKVFVTPGSKTVHEK